MRFVLVHGGFHAAWCWERTIGELARLGHEAVAVDLPGHGARVEDPLTAWTIPERRDAIVEVLRPGDVLVGHSGGGFDATVAADAVVDKVGHIVYLAAVLPREGRTYPEAMAMRGVASHTDATTASTKPSATTVRAACIPKRRLVRSLTRKATG